MSPPWDRQLCALLLSDLFPEEHGGNERLTPVSSRPSQGPAHLQKGSCEETTFVRPPLQAVHGPRGRWLGRVSAPWDGGHTPRLGAGALGPALHPRQTHSLASQGQRIQGPRV